ncbi:GDSL esterase/lipase At2g23540-like [Dioscorea cayenensis subsp. rotundata]|uniref:GDSL esterase/lipase At2g23540-like n=1 Tax=Dioscorea cayennensis subsp. rotundata TaxID=55577 RepID=A0AB40BN80_DIOCR|nr:GDSL esterase/lipase At2g23540-like [Dioscorea cayenensis subsp. rotundata]
MGEKILNGVNYASGAGGILNHTGSLFVNRLGMDIQIDYFNTTRKQLDELLGKAGAKEYMTKKTMLSIVIGSNDILNNYLLPGISTAQMILQPPDQFLQQLISHFRAQLMRLYSLDARKFVVTNIGPLGCIPYQRTLNQMSESECVSLPNDLAMQYNALLKNLLEELNYNFPQAKFLYANLYDVLMELIQNHQQYGFDTASVACCGIGGKYAGFIPCGPTSPMCWDRSKYVFWDPYHPTEATNLIISQNFMDGQLHHISPSNIRQLINNFS